MTTAEQMRRVHHLPTLGVLADLAERCNRDVAFGEWARRLDAIVLLRVGPDAAWVHIQLGKVVSIGEGNPAVHQIEIDGPAEAWDDILDGLRGGLHRAWRHQLLRFAGDRVLYMQHYKAFWRLGELLTELEVRP
jgi:hypothetical protein